MEQPTALRQTALPLLVATAMLVSAFLATGFVAASDADPARRLEMQGIEGRHTATLLEDGTVLVIGGTGHPDDPGGTVELYDPTERTFSPLDPLWFPRSSHTATRLRDGRVAVIGGIAGGIDTWAPVGEVEIFDPQTQSFSPAGRLKVPRHDHSALALPDGRVLVLAGADFSRTQPGAVRAVEIYDPIAQASKKIGRLQPFIQHVAVGLEDGYVLVVGSTLKGDPAFFRTREVAVLLDPATGKSERLQRGRKDLVRRSAERLADGRVLMIDGRRAPLLFDQATRRFAEIDRPSTGLAGSSLTLLDDGSVMVVGGEELGPAIVESFDPLADAFELVGELSSARRAHQATKLEDGTVLLTGGYGIETPLRNGEIYDPVSRETVAHGPIPAMEAAAPTPTPRPVFAPLGSFREGGRVELPGSGFRVTFPKVWSVEVRDPDRDYGAAAPGDTWTALRATEPGGHQACTVAVGVVPDAADGLELEVDIDETATEAYWRGRRRLMLPQPQVEPLGDGLGGVTGGYERRARTDPTTDHDVLYGMTCLSAHEEMPDRAFRRFKLMPAPVPDPATQGKGDRDREATPAPLPPLGATVEGGRITMAGSGFAMTVPEDWVVELAEPEPDIDTAAPGDAWEALRARSPNDKRACSVHVGMVPLEDDTVYETLGVDTDDDATAPYWSGGARPTLVVPTVRFRERSGTSTDQVSGQPRIGIDGVGSPDHVFHVVACGADGERISRDVMDSYEALDGDS